MQLSRGRTEKREALEFVADELRRQPHTGEGLVAFVAQAHQVYADQADPDDHQELLETLEAHPRRAAGPVAGVVGRHPADGRAGRLEEANSLAREATDRFPLLAKLWLDRAQVCHAMGNAEGRLDALRQAVAVAPGWSPAARELAEALDDAGEPDEAVAVLERAADAQPARPVRPRLPRRAAVGGRAVARGARPREDRRPARARVRLGVARGALWAERLEVPDEPAELARELTRDRAGDPRVWLRLARLLHHPRHNDEVLAALDRAIALDPKNVEAHDLKAERLAEMGRYDAALAAAQAAASSADGPAVRAAGPRRVGRGAARQLRRRHPAHAGARRRRSDLRLGLAPTRRVVQRDRPRRRTTSKPRPNSSGSSPATRSR